MTLKFMSSRIEELIYGITFDARTATGAVAFNTAVVAEDDLERVLSIFKLVYAAGLNVGPYVRIIPVTGGDAIDATCRAERRREDGTECRRHSRRPAFAYRAACRHAGCQQRRSADERHPVEPRTAHQLELYSSQTSWGTAPIGPKSSSSLLAVRSSVRSRLGGAPPSEAPNQDLLGGSGGSRRRADVSDLRLAMGSCGRSDGVPRLCCHRHVVVEHAYSGLE